MSLVGSGSAYPQALRLRQRVLEVSAAGGHLRQDVVGRPVDDGVNLANLVRRQVLAKRPDHRDTAAHAGLEVQVAILRRGQLQQLDPVRGHHFLVGRHDVLAGLERAADIAIGGLDAAHQFHDDVDGLVVKHVVHVDRQLRCVQWNVASALWIADQRAPHLERTANLALQVAGPLGDRANHGRTDGAQSQEPESDLCGHPPLSTRSAVAA